MSQLVIAGILLLLSAVLNAWAFPVKSVWLVVCVIFLLAIVFYFIKSKLYTRLEKSVAVPVAAVILAFFLLNSNFYPKLLQYQAGQNLAAITKGKVDPANVYVRPNSYSASYVFYTHSIFKKFDDSLLRSGRSVWLLTEPEPFEQVKAEGYQTGQIYSAPHFRISKLDLKFLNPETRDKRLSKMMLVEITGKQ